MVKDYAKYKVASKEPAKSTLPIKSIVVFFSLMIVIVALFFHFWKKEAPVADLVTPITEPQPAAKTPEAKEVIIVPASDQPTFDFYDILTDSDNVAPPPQVTAVTKDQEWIATPPVKSTEVSAKPAASKKADAIARQYKVLLGEYKTHREAQKNRAAFILIGLDVKLNQYTLKAGMVYRLEMGPYTTWQQAHVAQLMLEQKHQVRGKII